eukprot:901552-Amphidinium_carterae.1
MALVRTKARHAIALKWFWFVNITHRALVAHASRGLVQTATCSKSTRLEMEQEKLLDRVVSLGNPYSR